MVNKKGWIRVVESFVAIFIIAGVVLLVITIDQNRREDVSSQTYISLVSIIRDIELNNTLRDEIINVDNLPLEWVNFSSTVPLTYSKIIAKTPGYLECNARLCGTIDPCLIQSSDKTVYAESVIISANLQEYNPRILKLFCWNK